MSEWILSATTCSVFKQVVSPLPNSLSFSVCLFLGRHAPFVRHATHSPHSDPSWPLCRLRLDSSERLVALSDGHPVFSSWISSQYAHHLFSAKTPRHFQHWQKPCPLETSIHNACYHFHNLSVLLHNLVPFFRKYGRRAVPNHWQGIHRYHHLQNTLSVQDYPIFRSQFEQMPEFALYEMNPSFMGFLLLIIGGCLQSIATVTLLVFQMYNTLLNCRKNLSKATLGKHKTALKSLVIQVLWMHCNRFKSLSSSWPLQSWFCPQC